MFMFLIVGVPVICLFGALFKPFIFGPILLVWLTIIIWWTTASDNKERKRKFFEKRKEEAHTLFEKLNSEEYLKQVEEESSYSNFYRVRFFDNTPRFSYKEGHVPTEAEKLVYLGAEANGKKYYAEGKTTEEVKKKILEMIEKDFTEAEKNEKHETFSEMVERIIVEKDMKSTDFYKVADIDRKIYSAMKNNINYQPKKETAIAACFGLKLNLKQSLILLSTAGYSLSSSIKRDVIIMYAINNKLTVRDVNELLDDAGEKCLRNI